MNDSNTEKGNAASMRSTGLSDLLGKKSVRATFRLRPTAVELLSILDAVAKHTPASRNDLIERSIQRLLPVLEKERIRLDKTICG
jgi:hypothetical protein